MSLVTATRKLSHKTERPGPTRLRMTVINMARAFLSYFICLGFSSHYQTQWIVCAVGGVADVYDRKY